MATNIQFFYLLDIVLISRLVNIFKDNPMKKGNIIFMVIFQFIGFLFFEVSWQVLILFFLFTTINIVFFYLEKNSQNRNQLDKLNNLRLISLFLFIVVSSVFLAPWAGIKTNSSIIKLIDSFSDYFLLAKGITNLEWLNISIIIFGVLLATSEANLLIRYIFKRFDLTPKTADKKVDTNEYNAGRVIGILERALIFYLVFNTEFRAIGFILAAKSFTRFKDLEKRSFAEYVLIGTLLSATIAIFIAGFFIWLLP